MKFLGKYDINQDAVLPIVAQDTGYYQFVDKGGEYDGFKISVTKDEQITIPSKLLEQNLIHFKLKRRVKGLPYLRVDNNTEFGILGEKGTPNTDTGGNDSGTASGSADEIIQEEVIGNKDGANATFYTSYTFNTTAFKLWLNGQFIFKRNDTVYGLTPNNRKIELGFIPDIDDEIIVEYYKL